MNLLSRRTITTICFLLMLISFAQFTLAEDGNRRWSASWITVPGTTGQEYGVYYFRKTVDLTDVPTSFPVKVSGDPRYKLYVNGTLVSLGPARSDLNHWRYETVDLASHLTKGANVVAAVIWHEGADKPVANASLRTAFILQGESEAASVFNTDGSWKCVRDEGYTPISVHIPSYYVTGPGEQVDMSRIIPDWKEVDGDLSSWKDAQILSVGLEQGSPERVGECGSMDGWQLQPDPLPQMELTYQRLQTLRSAEGCAVPKAFPKEKASFTVPANTKATLILDQDHLTNAYFSLAFSGGKEATITATYLESYYTGYPNKGNRNEVEGKSLTATGAEIMAYYNMPLEGEAYERAKEHIITLGRQDKILPNGSDNQTFTTLYWRTYRYVQLDIETKEQPLTLEDVYGTFTGYPFALKASLDTEDAEMQKIFEIGWRTARLCAVDTYMDCPYYEQLQYLGDTRIQALITLYLTGDTRLPRNFLYLTDISRTAEGITMSRYPQTSVQVITPFSLWYIGSLHDYMLYANDAAFVRQRLPGMRQILNYFSCYQTEDGTLKDLPGWNFTDWIYIDGWNTGVAEKGADGRSALMDLQLLLGYQTAARLEKALGMEAFATLYEEEAQKLKKAIQSRYWDASRGLYADRSERDHFSQHANILAILTDMVTGEEATTLARKMLSTEGMAEASLYFKFYLHQALLKAGLGEDYMDRLGVWRDNIAHGLTTWAETSDIDGTRSDCHAWGASPNIEFFRTVLGIDSDALGFQKVKIEPHLGKITKISGEMPHPNGTIHVSYEISKKGKLNAVITLPADITGRFLWKGTEHPLKGGENKLEL